MELRALNLYKRYGDTAVVSDLSLHVQNGEIVGLLGPNGAGKSTTVGMLYGRVIPTSGTVCLGDWDVRRHGDQARRYMGVVTQDDNLDPDLNVWQNLLCFARYYQLVGPAAKARINAVLEQVDLWARRDDSVESLSGGMRRRLVLARTLLNHPKIVFLDEPTTGLDPDARQDFWQLVLQLKAMGCGVILTTHYMDEAEKLCDRLLLLQAGRNIDEGSPSDLIRRTVGHEVIEVEGVSETVLRDLAAAAQVWGRPAGQGYVIVVPDRDPDSFCQHIEAWHPVRFSRRRANLEDVFLKLTGSVL